MEKKIAEQYREHLLKQKEILQQAVKQLKAEFVGINPVIDRIADAITAWLYFPEMQDRPVIINLWGLTGIGKTSVVKRFTELIGYTDRYFRFDLGESTNRYFDIQDSFKDIYEKCDGEPFIIGLDEFQLARTINEDQEEVDKASSRAIWDLLDSGKFDVIDFDYSLNWFCRYIKKLDMALLKGVIVENGVIVANEETYREIMQLSNDDEDETPTSKTKTYFVTESDLRSIFDLVDHLYLTKAELQEKLLTLDGDGCIDYLIDLYKKAVKPKTVDCTKALVFIMGNLDEVYTMSRDFNPDVNADEFHRQSCEITITQVKDSLLSRFRSEQIARLGNTHIIYPAFNQESFYKIIRLELEKISRQVTEKYQLQLHFESSVEQLIYEEGVYPTQGTRPLFTTVHQIVKSRLGKILNEVYIEGVEADAVRIKVKDCKKKEDHAAIQMDFLKAGIPVHQLIDNQMLELGKLRKEKQNDMQAIVAVHESGHAILSSILMKTIPESVFSVTADNESSGFVLARPQWNYISKKEIVNRLAVMLGGYVAERVIFGDENVTIGSTSDLSKATSLATFVLYNCGMGNTRVTYGNENMQNQPSVIFDNRGETINQEAKLLMIKAEKLAQQTLENQKSLLLHMANYLSDKRMLKKEQLKEYIAAFAVGFNISEIIESKDAEHLYYRKQLKQLVKENALCELVLTN